jgi:tRNA(Ile)-lysidine synthase
MKPLRRFGSAALVRPFLDLSKSDLRAYAERHRLEWRDDLSNASDAYDRTHVRALLQRFGGSAPVVRTARLIDTHYADLIGPQFDAVWERAINGDHLLLEPLRDLHPTLRDLVLTDALRNLLRVRPTEARVEQVGRLIDAQKGKRITIGDASVWREQDALRFVRRPPVQLEMRPVVPNSQTKWNRYSLIASEPTPRTETLPLDPSEAWIAAGAPWPLTVRRWKAGDALQTLGEHTKLVSDVLTEGHVPSSERANWPVVCAGDAIVWVPGMRRASAWLVDVGAPAVRMTWREESDSTT